MLEYIGIGAEEGANLVYGGHSLTGGIYDHGYYVEPTIFADVNPDMRIAREEIFGPVLTVFQARDLEDAVQISNNVQFGLSSSVYTRDLPRAFRYINTVDAGMVHVNAPTLGGEGPPAFRRAEGLGSGTTGAGGRGGGLFQRGDNSLHRLRRCRPYPGQVYLIDICPIRSWATESTGQSG